MSYDPELITNYFDSYGNDEWKRLVSSPKNLMSLHIHQHYLAKYLRQGDQVLELGAGAGRYTIFLAELGASVVTSDISSVQLELNRKHVSEAGLTNQVSGYLELDITDLSNIDQQFDAVVAIGGPLSYTLDKKAIAMEHMLSKVKPGGLLILGVMSRWGGMQRLIKNYASDILVGDLTILDIYKTGDDLGYLAFEGHHHHMFTYNEIQQFLEDFPVRIEDASATSYLTIQQGDHLDELVKNKEAWKKLVEMELTICKEIVDGGTHMILVTRKVE